MSEPTDVYELDTDFPIPELSPIEAGQNLLLIGPPDTDHWSLGLQLLAEGTSHDQGALVVTFDGAVEAITQQYRTFTEDETLSSLSIIDCTDPEESPDDLDDRQYFPVESPSRLTDIGMSFIEYDDAYAQNFAGNRVLVKSITTLLEHVSEERAFEFINALIGRFATAGYLGVWTIDSSAHDEQTLAKFAELFDDVVELRQEGETTEYQVRGVHGESSDWTSFSND